ncbi:SMI1/KNR4 family protein [Winogradskyella sp. F6397]|uniref:SMI1/KNR4 family protein n=1 Tax=Winogradskyella marina TaxID=2785530 RepID=A0ABS0EI05_9FLAO|nr:SMI1/KNR4 family protein [Winogradskyella marina]MBF8150017.1 SMI1/KNR4 family protein [Winogradskyella marina]
MNNTVDRYISGLKNAYYNAKGKAIWDHFESVKHGASQDKINELKTDCPAIPEALIHLLQYVDGTYWRTYGDEDIALTLLGSDLFKLDYYLLSSQQILVNQGDAPYNFQDYLYEGYDGVDIDEKLLKHAKDLNWLHFANCTNNGGTSQLYIDYSPSDKGKIGQVVRYLHDPNEFEVIADSFEAYLQMLMDKEFSFIREGYLE